VVRSRGHRSAIREGWIILPDSKRVQALTDSYLQINCPGSYDNRSSTMTATRGAPGIGEGVGPARRKTRRTRDGREIDRATVLR
jgi:hypothetical protein